MSITPNENSAIEPKAAFIPLPTLSKTVSVLENMFLGLFYVLAAVAIVAGLGKNLDMATTYGGLALLSMLFSVLLSWAVPGLDKSELEREDRKYQ